MKLQHASILTLALSTPGLFATSIILDDFDDNSPAGWSSLGNSLGADHSITESGSSLTSQVVANQANLNTHRGIVSTTSFNPAAEAGFTMTFDIASQGATAPGANGLFLGLTNDSTEFFRVDGVSSFGLSFFGHAARTNSVNGVSLTTNDIGAGGSATEGFILDANPSSIQLASLQDGFSATLGADPTGWSFSVTGVNNTGGTPVTVANSGTWADAGTTYASVFAGANWHALASNQGDPSNNTHTLVLDRVSLETLDVIPEPTSALLGLFGFSLLLARRR